LSHRGRAKLAQDDWEGAIVDFTRAIALNPSYAEAYDGRGLAKIAQGNWDAAIADLDRAIALNPSYAQAYNSRGLAKRAKSDWNRAIADFDRAIALNPNNAQAFNNRGIANEASGEFDRARSDYTKCISLEPKGSNYVRFRLALVLRRQGAEEGTVGLTVMLRGPGNGWTKAVAQFLSGTLTESDLLDQASVGDAKTVRRHQCEAYYYSGMAHLLKREPAKARSSFEQCTATGVTGAEEFTLAKAELARKR
jgi:lipoprotein NlpI